MFLWFKRMIKCFIFFAVLYGVFSRQFNHAREVRWFAWISFPCSSPTKNVVLFPSHYYPYKTFERSSVRIIARVIRNSHDTLRRGRQSNESISAPSNTSETIRRYDAVHFMWAPVALWAPTRQTFTSINSLFFLKSARKPNSLLNYEPRDNFPLSASVYSKTT